MWSGKKACTREMRYFSVTSMGGSGATQVSVVQHAPQGHIDQVKLICPGLHSQGDKEIRDEVASSSRGPELRHKLLHIGYIGVCFLVFRKVKDDLWLPKGLSQIRKKKQ